jgi:hypothetical protein
MGTYSRFSVGFFGLFCSFSSWFLLLLLTAGRLSADPVSRKKVGAWPNARAREIKKAPRGLGSVSKPVAKRVFVPRCHPVRPPHEKRDGVFRLVE